MFAIQRQVFNLVGIGLEIEQFELVPAEDIVERQRRVELVGCIITGIFVAPVKAEIDETPV